jgi:hypothetical protein
MSSERFRMLNLEHSAPVKFGKVRQKWTSHKYLWRFLDNMKSNLGKAE